jgi:hypothetical protein
MGNKDKGKKEVKKAPKPKLKPEPGRKREIFTSRRRRAFFAPERAFSVSRPQAGSLAGFGRILPAAASPITAKSNGKR